MTQEKQNVSHLEIRSEYICENQQGFIDDLLATHEYLTTKLKVTDSTWDYGLYNIFAASSPSLHMYRLYEEIRYIVRQQIPEGRLWIQAWLNHHTGNQTLDWHQHTFPLHGYVCIDPKNSVTEFEDWKVENEVGTIYLGPGHVKHRVLLNDKYEGTRLTIGYDIVTEESLQGDTNPSMNFGVIPLL